jgi:hypothetical protein
VVGRLKVSDLEAEVLHAEILLRAKRHWKGELTQGVGRLAWHDAEEGLVALCRPLEVEIHLLQGVDEDGVVPTSPINEGLREQGALDNGLDDYEPGSGM